MADDKPDEQPDLTEEEVEKASSLLDLRRIIAGTSALAVDTGTTFSAVPAGVLAAGDEFELPVLEVPASTPFIAIARVVVDALKADELQSVQRVVEQQEVLARATLRDGIPGVVSALADCLSATVVGGRYRWTAVGCGRGRTGTAQHVPG